MPERQVNTGRRTGLDVPGWRDLLGDSGDSDFLRFLADFGVPRCELLTLTVGEVEVAVTREEEAKGCAAAAVPSSAQVSARGQGQGRQCSPSEPRTKCDNRRRGAPSESEPTGGRARPLPFLALLGVTGWVDWGGGGRGASSSLLSSRMNGSLRWPAPAAVMGSACGCVVSSARRCLVRRWSGHARGGGWCSVVEGACGGWRSRRYSLRDVRGLGGILTPDPLRRPL